MTSLTETPDTRLTQSPGARPGVLVTGGLVALGFGTSFYVGSVPTPRPGLEYLWVLPLWFALCAFLFARIVPYHRGGVGLKVLYTVVVVRYVLSPTLIAASGGEMSGLSIPASAEGYRFAIVVMMAELLVYCCVIRVAWPRRVRALRERIPSSTALDRISSSVDGVTFGGLLLVAALTLVVSFRGLAGIQSSMGFLLLTERYEAGVVDSYGITAAQGIKSFLFIGVAVWCSRMYRARGGAWWFVVATLAAFLNLATYFGYNRSLVVQTAIATITTLVFLFPRMRKHILVFLVPVAAGILYSMITMKQFGTSVSQGGVEGMTVARNSEMIETYVGSLWTLATAFDAATASAHQVSLLTALRTFTDNFFPFKVPGLTWPNDLLAGVPSVIDMYQAYTWPALGAMLPLGGEMWFYGGDVLGPVLVLVAPGAVALLLVEVELRARLASSAQVKFIYTWLAVLFGMAMCYCSITLVWSISKFALFLALMFWINNRLVLRHRMVSYR